VSPVSRRGVGGRGSAHRRPAGKDLVTPTHRIAVIPGDGISREVVPAAQEVLEEVASRHGFGFA
jgi:hypothetical protein